jgi:hypothetical protein
MDFSPSFVQQAKIDDDDYQTNETNYLKEPAGGGINQYKDIQGYSKRSIHFQKFILQVYY